MNGRGDNPTHTHTHTHATTTKVKKNERNKKMKTHTNAAFFFQLTQRSGHGEHGACWSWETWQRGCDWSVGWLVGLKASHLKKGYCIFKTLTELTERQRPTRPRLGFNQPPFFVFFYLQVI